MSANTIAAAKPAAAKAEPKVAAKPAEPKAEPTKAEPYATVEVETKMVPAYRGQLTVITPAADGKGEQSELVECPHVRYGHESESAALKCAKAEAYRRGLKVR